MSTVRPAVVILIGLALVILGWVIAFLMVMKILQSSFLLGLVSYLASMSGLILGVIGAATYVREHRNRD